MTETRWVSPGSTHPTTLAGRGPSTYDPVGAVPILVGAAKEAGEMARMATTTGSSRAIGLVVGLSAGVLLMPAAASANVSHATGTVNGVACDVWTWTDSNSKTRTVALKMEGHGNPGHGGATPTRPMRRPVGSAKTPAARRPSRPCPVTATGPTSRCSTACLVRRPPTF
jgi:hypothetical protein